jgi:excisionase family DNA binding protein
VADRLLRAEDVAERLQLPVDHVYRLCREQRIPHLRFGRTLRFRDEAITRWPEEEERGRRRAREIVSATPAGPDATASLTAGNYRPRTVWQGIYLVMSATPLKFEGRSSE